MASSTKYQFFLIQATDIGNKDAQCAIKINFNTVSRELIYA